MSLGLYKRRSFRVHTLIAEYIAFRGIHIWGLLPIEMSVKCHQQAGKHLMHIFCVHTKRDILTGDQTYKRSIRAVLLRFISEFLILSGVCKLLYGSKNKWFIIHFANILTEAFQLLEYQMIWRTGQIWYSRDLFPGIAKAWRPPSKCSQWSIHCTIG